MKIHYFVIVNKALDVMFYNDLLPKQKTSRLPIITVAIDKEKGHIGYTVNCPKDNFSRRFGRVNAVDRLNEIVNEPYGTVNGPDTIYSVSPFTAGLVENVYNFCIDHNFI